MSRYKVHATIFCPYMGPDDDDFCGAPVRLVIDPPERRTWEYPGSPAAIASVEGCPHAAAMEEDELLDAVADQADLMTPRERDDGRY